LMSPAGLCFMPDNRHVAVADRHHHRVSVFSVGGSATWVLVCSDIPMA
jgi:hypothetical protein